MKGSVLFYRFTFKVARISVFLTGCLFTSILLFDYDKDTTAFSNGAFAILASLAALSFSFARCIDSKTEERDRVLFAGERFFQGALFMINASILKFALIAIGMVTDAAWAVTILKIVTLPIGIATFLFFFLAVSEADKGLTIVFDHLENNRNRKAESEKG